MEVLNIEDRPPRRVDMLPYKGRPNEVKGVTIQWLSMAGGAEDSPEYGLRFFRIGPGGFIPLHNHFYVQTMYILRGRFTVASHDPETDAKIDEKEVGPDDAVFVPSMEPHSMRNISDTEEGAFLCCIGNVYDGEGTPEI